MELRDRVLRRIDDFKGVYIPIEGRLKYLAEIRKAVDAEFEIGPATNTIQQEDE